MISFGFMNLFGLICLIFPCQGVIFPPSSGDSLTFLPGSTGKIEWSFDDNISDVFSRSWSFTSTDGSFKDKTIATVSDDDNPKIRVSFPVIAVEKPATLVLKNVDHRYDGKYEFRVQSSTESSSEVTVFIAGLLPSTMLPSSTIRTSEITSSQTVASSDISSTSSVKGPSSSSMLPSSTIMTSSSSISPTSSVKDVDECKNATLYNCGKGYDCANTLGSYACVCHGRKVNTECVKDAIRHRVQLTIKQNYTTTLGNRASTEFKNLESRIKNAFQTVFTKAGNKKYLELEITKFSSGSIIADMDVLFRKGDETGMKELLAAVRNNSFGDFDVDPDALQVVITGACPPNGPDICPGNSTCKKLTESTIKCPCNKDFYFDGVTCIRNVVVKVEIVLKKEFTPALKNESSKEYIELKEDITNKLTETFKDTPNFERVEVTGFRNGSLVVEFRVIYRRDPDTNKKVVVGETLREKIINNEGKLGEYEIKGDIFIQEPPPPPKSLIHSKVTENRIDIRWEAPAANDFFYIFGYIVSHKEKSQLKYKTQNETSVTLNVILSKLKSNTFYDITVHGYNKEGSGDKIEISVKTKEEDSSDGVVVIIIVVIVVVLLIIVGIVVFYNIRKRTRERHLEQPMRMGKMGEPKEFYNLGHKQDEMSRGDNPQS